MKRLPRKKKKAMRHAMILECGNPVVHKVRMPKRRWVSMWRAYKSTATTIKIPERREANQVKIKNL